ncbi:hypothetical protein PRVXT_000234 [Proteinivorax tanatarense]|uniref:Short-chain dehydrogenase n=1 Tax=Proteinivorax tanatarense TaxID=1260629 RepID=A0AAU7VMD6_9FIRM
MNITELTTNDTIFSLGLYNAVTIERMFNESKIVFDYEEEKLGIDGLYVMYSDEMNELLKFMNDRQKLHGFCPYCNKELVFNLTSVEINSELLERKVCVLKYSAIGPEEYDSMERHKDYKCNERIELLKNYTYFNKKAICTFDSSHIMNFFFKLDISYTGAKDSVTLTKVGQSPSYTEMNRHKHKKFSKVLKQINSYDDYVKGDNLFSHDVGVGAFVYLRRILEKILLFKFNDYTKHKGEKKATSIHEFKNMEMEKKIKLLKGYLPKEFDNLKQVYGILSSGIHNLEEDSCKGYYPVLKTAIDLILLEQKESMEKEKLKNKNKSAINKITPEVGEKADKELKKLAGSKK